MDYMALAARVAEFRTEALDQIGPLTPAPLPRGEG